MAVYKFLVSMPVTDTLPRNRIQNTLHFQHVAGTVLDTDLEAVCADLCTLYQHHYGSPNQEVEARAYSLGAPPQLPKAKVVVDAGMPWGHNSMREQALVLSFAGNNRGDKRRRGRIYLEPGIVGTLQAVDKIRPDEACLQWALAFYAESNSSFPDIGGPDWQFGIWSERGQHFTVAEQAWVNDDWDVQRRRGLRETRRVTATRQG